MIIFGVIHRFLRFDSFYYQMKANGEHSSNQIYFIYSLAEKMYISSVACYVIDHFVYQTAAAVNVQNKFFHIIRPLFFPAMWTYAWIHYSQYSETASWGAQVFALSEDPFISQLIVPTVGILGGEFFLALLGNAVADLCFPYALQSTLNNSQYSFGQYKRLSVFFRYISVYYCLLIVAIGLGWKVNQIGTFTVDFSDGAPALTQMFQHIPAANVFTSRGDAQQSPWGFARRDFKLHVTCLAGFDSNIDASVNKVRRAMDDFEFTESKRKVTPRQVSSTASSPPPSSVEDFLCAAANGQPRVSVYQSDGHVFPYDPSRDFSALLPSAPLHDPANSDSQSFLYEGYPLHIVIQSETAISSVKTDEDELCLYERMKKSLKPRTIIAFTYRKSVPDTPNKFLVYNKMGVVFHEDLSFQKAVTALNLAKVNAVPLFEPNTVGDHIDDHISAAQLPQGMTLLGENVKGFICFDMDFHQMWFAGSRRPSLLLNPSVTWGVEGFRRLHARKQELVARETNSILVRCSSEGESVVMDAWGNTVRQMTRSGDVFKATVTQTMIDFEQLRDEENVKKNIYDGHVAYWRALQKMRTPYGYMSAGSSDYHTFTVIVFSLTLFVFLLSVFFHWDILCARWGFMTVKYQLKVGEAFVEAVKDKNSRRERAVRNRRGLRQANQVVSTQLPQLLIINNANGFNTVTQIPAMNANPAVVNVTTTVNSNPVMMTNSNVNPLLSAYPTPSAPSVPYDFSNMNTTNSNSINNNNIQVMLLGNINSNNQTTTNNERHTSFPTRVVRRVMRCLFSPQLKHLIMYKIESHIRRRVASTVYYSSSRLLEQIQSSSCFVTNWWRRLTLSRNRSIRHFVNSSSVLRRANRLFNVHQHPMLSPNERQLPIPPAAGQSTNEIGAFNKNRNNFIVGVEECCDVLKFSSQIGAPPSIHTASSRESIPMSMRLAVSPESELHQTNWKRHWKAEVQFGLVSCWVGNHFLLSGLDSCLFVLRLCPFVLLKALFSKAKQIEQEERDRQRHLAEQEEQESSPVEELPFAAW
eukprot:GDKJ01031754.1.p1 GENE.GDKJ01031754.1~~GDKJ01031754.1.p1  ORF type:complete len:1097 (+),score=237.20 GDKJ01031754.1:189-3293(+)